MAVNPIVMNAFKSYETERLILRPTSEADAPFVLELLNTPNWLRYIGDRDVRTVAEASQYIRNKMLPQLQKLGYCNYTVIRKSDKAVLGLCGLYDREGVEGIDIGFAFLPPYEGQGYAYEAAIEVKRAGIEDFGITQISAITSKQNVASQKLLLKLGLSYSKLIRLPNSEGDIMLYIWKA